MAERKAINKYYPPDFDPSKHGSINKYHGQHHLRDRAKKLDQGILVVRFEMPYNVWCLGCNCHIGMGVRYNAEKKTVGKYFTTNILTFKMKCHQCSSQFEIETDPKNNDYKIISGLKRKTEDFDITQNNSNNGEDNDNDPNITSLIQKTKEEIKEFENDNTLFKLEYKKQDEERGKKQGAQLDQLLDFMGNRSTNDYKLSSLMRKSFREKKNEEEKELKRQQSKGIIIPLLKDDDNTNQDDLNETNEIDFKFNSLKRKLDQDKKQKRELIKNEPIIKNTTTTTTNNSTITKTNIEGIIKKKSRIDPSLFKSNQQSRVNNVFGSNLFK